MFIKTSNPAFKDFGDIIYDDMDKLVEFMFADISGDFDFWEDKFWLILHKFDSCCQFML